MDQKMIIDVDKVIEARNNKNQKSRQLTRKDLAKQLGVNVQVFSDWKNGKTPKLVYRLFKMMEIGKCKLEDFVIPEE